MGNYYWVHNRDKIPKHKLSKRRSIQKDYISRGTWVTQSVNHPTSIQVTILWFVSLSPMLGSVVTGWSLEPASDSVSPSLSLCPSPAHTLFLSLSLKNK